MKGLRYLKLSMVDGEKRLSEYGDLGDLESLNWREKKAGSSKQLDGLFRMKKLKRLYLMIDGLTEIPLQTPMKKLSLLDIWSDKPVDLSFLRFMPNLVKINLADSGVYTHTEFLCSHKRLKSYPENADVFKRLCTRN